MSTKKIVYRKYTRTLTMESEIIKKIVSQPTPARASNEGGSKFSKTEI